jgi:hypothetical protein
MLWSPTIRAALVAGTPWLDVFCPGCVTSRAIDLRTVDRHPLASVGTLVLGLRCSWCPGSAPMPKLLGLFALRRPGAKEWLCEVVSGDLFRHCRAMEMHDFPIRATLRDKKCDATARAKSLAIFNTSDGVQARDDDRGIRQNHSLVIVECGASRHVVPELLKILVNSFRIGHDRFAARAEKQCIRRVKIRNAINVRSVERLAPLFDDLKRILLGACDRYRRKGCEHRNGGKKYAHFFLPNRIQIKSERLVNTRH